MNKIYKLSIILLITGLQLTFSSQLFAQNLNKEIFAERRQKLMDQLGNSIAIFKGANLILRNGDVYHDYRQSSDFYYLTGYEEPDAAFILMPEDEKKFILFVHKKSFGEELFGGKQKSIKEIMNIYNADTAFTMNEFDKVFEEYLEGKEKFYYALTEDKFDEKIKTTLTNLIELNPEQIIDPTPIIHEMRIFKDSFEIKRLKKTIDITCDAHIEAMKAAEPGMNEYELNAIINYIYQKNGSPRWGFPSIIASGINSTVLHYQKNDSPMNDGDLVMVDIGAEYGYYSADVTRTFPVNGTFSKEQKEIYEIALKATDESIKMVKPGIGFKEVHNRSVDVIKDGLYDLGLIADKESPWQYRLWYMYYSMHWIGLDVHDVGDAKLKEPNGRILKPSMVIAIEPGIYINKKLFNDFPNLAKKFMPYLTKEQIDDFMIKVKPAVEKYANICCRVEDDVLITEEGVINLSSKAPRKIIDIENLMAETSHLVN